MLSLIHVIDAASFNEAEEILLVKSERPGQPVWYIGMALFFNPSGRTLYAGLQHGTLHANSMSGTYGKMSLVLNGGLGSRRMSASTKIRFITPFVVHQNISNKHSSKKSVKAERPKLD